MPSLAITDVFTPALASSWLSTMLSIGSTLGLPTQSWQSGGVARTILSILSNIQSGQDAIVSMAAQGGFLDFAATGTVTYTNTNGATVTVPVTPDPSVPAQWPIPGTPPLPGWLDFLADSTFNCQRIQASPASGNLTFANTSGSPSSTYGIGTYHVANPNTGFTYSNSAPLTIAASTPIGTSITNVTNSSGLYQIHTSSVHNLTNGTLVYITGVVGTGGLNPNGFWTVSNAGTVGVSMTFTLQSSSFTGAYTSGGTVYTTQQAQFAADVTGTGSTTLPMTITSPVTVVLGVFCTNFFSWVGSNVEGNVALAARCRLKIQSLSPGAPSGAYAFFALSSSQLLEGFVLSGVQLAGTQSLLSTPITQALVAVNTTTGVVTTTVANSSGAVNGVSNLAVQTVADSGLGTIVTVTVQTSTTGMNSGDTVYIAGVQGYTYANGYWTIQNVLSTTFQLSGSSGTAQTYTTGGVIEDGDLGLVDSVIQANCVPLGITALTQSATAVPIYLTTTVFVPAAQANAVTAAITTALASYFASIPIGGFTTGVPTPNSVPYNEVLGIIEGAAPYIRAATLLMGTTPTPTGTSDIVLTSTQVATLSASGLSTVIITVQTF